VDSLALQVQRESRAYWAWLVFLEKKACRVQLVLLEKSDELDFVGRVASLEGVDSLGQKDLTDHQVVWDPQGRPVLRACQGQLGLLDRRVHAVGSEQLVLLATRVAADHQEISAK